MSAPDTKAVPPAPVSTTTRMSESLRHSASMAAVASHISSETALRRSGLLKVTVPTWPSLRNSILSVMSSSLDLVLADTKRQEAFAARGVFQSVAGLAQQVGNIDGRKRVGAFDDQDIAGRQADQEC